MEFILVSTQSKIFARYEQICNSDSLFIQNGDNNILEGNLKTLCHSWIDKNIQAVAKKNRSITVKQQVIQFFPYQKDFHFPSLYIFLSRDNFVLRNRFQFTRVNTESQRNSCSAELMRLLLKYPTNFSTERHWLNMLSHLSHNILI